MAAFRRSRGENTVSESLTRLSIVLPQSVANPTSRKTGEKWGTPRTAEGGCPYMNRFYCGLRSILIVELQGHGAVGSCAAGS